MLLASRCQLQEVEAENSRLQLQLKELNEEYRSRLARYIKDVAVGTPGPRGSAGLGRALHVGCYCLQAAPASLPCRAVEQSGQGGSGAVLTAGRGLCPLGLAGGGDSRPPPHPNFPYSHTKGSVSFCWDFLSWSDHLA